MCVSNKLILTILPYFYRENILEKFLNVEKKRAFILLLKPGYRISIMKEHLLKNSGRQLLMMMKSLTTHVLSMKVTILTMIVMTRTILMTVVLKMVKKSLNLQ